MSSYRTLSTDKTSHVHFGGYFCRDRLFYEKGNHTATYSDYKYHA